jgi:hypothetical protein
MGDTKELKELLDRELEEVEEQLQNGEGSSPATHGKALQLILRHVRIMVKRNNVTEAECAERRAKMLQEASRPHAATIAQKDPIVAELLRQGGWLAWTVYLIYLLVTK